ncbi:hypothetical protein QYE76_029663 [Lolium multiflorum]|uniref:Uncharacterized protein n=1 Tax=Lolium multiflorum TaxID=4521 RepID=A0AAD8VII0_LOLMU|nr:hypothetical protein QYE76_029663 [Lolium multiflorum]
MPPPEAPRAQPSRAAPNAPPAKASGAASTAPPPKPSKLIKGKATASSAPSGGQQPLVLHVSKAAKGAAMKATGLLGRITEFQRQGRDLGHLLPYAQKWNAADITPATRGMGKDRLPAPDPVGDRCSEEHFMRLRSALTADARKALFEELLWEHRELAEAHDKCQVIPEASIDALKEQLAAAQREKDQLSRQHQEELNALKTSYQELKSQLIQLGLDHAKALKAAEVNAAAKLDEARRMPAMPLCSTGLYGLARRCRTPSPLSATVSRVPAGGSASGSALLPALERTPPSAPLLVSGARPGRLTSVREDANRLDPILTAKRQDRAYHIAEYADMRTFIPPPPDVKDYLDEEEDEAEEELLDDADAGDAPPEAPAA